MASTTGGNNQGLSHQNRQLHSPRYKQSDSGETTNNPAPIYITVGPQCCGKSSFLRNYNDGAIKDISLDDQQDVYIPISTEIFLSSCDDKDVGTTIRNKEQLQLQQVYHGKVLRERIRENTELILILQRWNGDLTTVAFDRRIKSYYEERKLPGNVATTLVETVEDFLSKNPSLPKKTDVFVVESLFRPHPQTGQSAIQRAHEELRQTPRHIPVAWGNTNSKPKDYERVLEICHQTRRPVHFILCHPSLGSSGANDENKEKELFTLPWLPLEVLLKRNLHRLQCQGRYIPANAVADCCFRVEAMLPDNVLKTKTVENHLVAIASPSYGGREPRRHNTRQRNATFRYSLNKNRVVQKEYPRNGVDSSSIHRQRNQNINFRRHNDERDRMSGNQRQHHEKQKNKRKYGGDNFIRGRRHLQREPQGQDDAMHHSGRRHNYSSNSKASHS